MASGNSCKHLSTIQRSYQKFWPSWVVILVLRDKTSSSSSGDSISTSRKTASGNSSKNLSSIQRSDQKLWPFSAVIPVWRDKTSSFRSGDSIGTTRKTASGNSCKTWVRSNSQIKSYDLFSCYSGLARQGLLFPVWRDKTSSSTSKDSIHTTRKMACGNSSKNLSAIQ